MRLTRSIAALLGALLILGAGATAALGATVEECQDQLADLRVDTVAAELQFTNAKDFNGAISKLDAAAKKLGEGKTADAAPRSRTSAAC